jgi:hypothetical protein
VGGLDLTQRGPNLIQGVQLTHLGVPDRTQRFGLCVQGSDAFLRSSGPTDGILEYITSPVHIASLGLPTCWGRVLIQGTDSGSWARLRGGNEPAGRAKV